MMKVCGRQDIDAVAVAARMGRMSVHCLVLLATLKHTERGMGVARRKARTLEVERQRPPCLKKGSHDQPQPAQAGKASGRATWTQSS